MEKFTPLLARILLSGIFLRSGFNKLLNTAGTQQYMESKGIPLSGVLLVPTILVLLLGSLSILLGFKARLGAWLLIGFLIPATLIFHTDFSVPDEVIAFWKNLGLMGGLLMITAFGAGAFSFDERNRPVNKKVTPVEQLK